MKLLFPRCSSTNKGEPNWPMFPYNMLSPRSNTSKLGKARRDFGSSPSSLFLWATKRSRLFRFENASGILPFKPVLPSSKTCKAGKFSRPSSVNEDISLSRKSKDSSFFTLARLFSVPVIRVFHRRHSDSRFAQPSNMSKFTFR